MEREPIRIYKEEMLLRTCHCDMMGTWRPSAILEVMQETAGTHGEMIGFGRKALMQQGLVWVISRLEVVMNRYPQIGDTVQIETFPTAVRRWFFPRYFIFRDQHGEELGRAGSLWLLLDWNTRHMARPDNVMKLLPDNSDLVAPLGLPATVTEVSGTSKKGVYIPQYTDMDCNMHVNNTKYMDWCCNALGIDTMRTHCLQRFDVNYSLEIRQGQTIETELRQLGDDFSFSGTEGEQRHFDIGGVLMER